MRSYFNKLSITLLTNKHLVFIVLMVKVLLDRINTFFRFSIIYTDSDQTVLWQVSKDLMNGIFHGPCFYGQSYNPIIEPLFSLPFLLIGMEYSTALPLTTILMSTFPFVLLSIYLFRKVDPLVGTIPLIILLLLSLEFGMLTSISRGFVTGLFFAIPGFVLMAFHSTLLSRFIGGLLFGVGVYANPNCILLLPLLLSFTTSFKESFWKMFIPAILGFCIGAFLIVINAWYYNLNPDLVICNMDKSVKLNMELTIEKGRGFVPAEENKKSGAPIGTIFTDSIYTPIKNVKYAIENFRVEQKTDYEKLIFDIETDGSINPKDALTEAAKILIHHFMLFSDERITLEADEIAQTETYDEESLHMRQLLKTRLIDMDLSVRALNCLKAAEVDTLGDLVSFNKSDLMKFRNFGKKSLTELEELVNVKGLNFGMDLVKYKLDRD